MMKEITCRGHTPSLFNVSIPCFIQDLGVAHTRQFSSGRVQGASAEAGGLNSRSGGGLSGGGGPRGRGEHSGGRGSRGRGGHSGGGGQHILGER